MPLTREGERYFHAIGPQYERFMQSFRANRREREKQTAEAINADHDAVEWDVPCWQPVSDFHAGDCLPPSNLYSAEARKMLDEEAREVLAEERAFLNAWYSGLLDDILGGPNSQYAHPNPLFGNGPITLEEASPMNCCNPATNDGPNLYSVTVIDPRGRFLAIDTKVVAKSPEAAKLAAGVYGWLEREGLTLEAVTVVVNCLACGVKVEEK